jgi:hypothetical protein
MPVFLTPRADEAIPTRRSTHPDWCDDPHDPLYEYVEILSFLRQEVLDAARKAGARQVRQGGRVVDELDVPKYLAHLFERQVKGWRLLDPHGQEIPFSQEALLRLPWDVGGWLHEQILACGGSIATRDLITEVDGIRLDFKREDAGLGTGDTPESPDPIRDGTIHPVGPRHRVARSG